MFLVPGTSAMNIYSSFTESSDSLPSVLAKGHTDLVESRLRNEALLKFAEYELPVNLDEWEIYRVKLKNEIIKKAGVIIDHDLPLNIKETGTVQMKGYIIKNIAFQTRPGVYATANLYIPDGKGPFPGIITMHGHWPGGRLFESFKVIGQSAALNGYVCLNIDAWGAGERTTIHGIDEYHGANLGASLMNIGESLVGVQVSDNMRGVDLLCSLPYVDPEKIGATGASGGGNQTMWLAALDERVKAAVPVVSIGTFESYIMRSNCVCELLIDGFTLSEEAGVIALVAPRAIKMCNIIHDYPTFLSSEMLRTFNNASPVFKMLNAENNISNLILDKAHDYWPENREAMLGWFDLHLKGTGNGLPKKETPFDQISKEKLMVFPKGHRDANVMSTDEYCRKKGDELRTTYLNTKSFNLEDKKKELHDILRLTDKSELKKVHHYSKINGWERFALETTDNKLIPVLLFAPAGKSSDYIIMSDPGGKKAISLVTIDQLKKSGSGIVLVDLTGTGELLIKSEQSFDKNMELHTVSRAELWLGRTLMGEWVEELDLVAKFLRANYKAGKITVEGTRETGLAGLFCSVLKGNVDEIILHNSPVSYLFDNRESVDYFNMAVHLPGFLNWGDVSLAASLSGKKVTFINPVTMSGQPIKDNKLKEFKTEFDNLRDISKRPESTVFK